MSDSPFVDFPAGSNLISEGEAASALFVLESGKAVVERADAPGVVLAELGPGDFCGEMSILQEQPHSASVTARSAVRALRIDVASFHAVLKENPEVGVHMMRRLVLRLKASEARRAQLENMASSPSAAPQRPAAASKPAPPQAAAKPAAAPAPKAPPVGGTTVQPAVSASSWALEHVDGAIPLPGGKNEMLIGRPDPATGAVPEINLLDLDTARTISRRHARLFLQGDALSLREEPGVGNGTWINGERLQAGQQKTLKSGDSLRFGAVELRLVQI